MESTRMHWLVIVVGLWMTSSASADEKTQAADAAQAGATARAAAANAALNLDDLEIIVAPPSDPSTDAATPVADAAAADRPRTTITTADAAETTLYPATSAGSEDAQPVASAPRRIIPRGAHARPQPANVSAAVADELVGAARAGTPTVPWYRGPYAALAGVLFIIGVLAVLARRFVPSVRPLGGDMLRVIGRVPIAAKQSAALLQVGQRLVLVGIGSDGLRTLSEITDPQEVALLLGKSAPPAPAENFDHLLAEELEEYEQPADGADEAQDEVQESLRATRGQLESLRSRIRAMQSA